MPKSSLGEGKMGRIGRTLDALRAKGRKALVAYITAGDPDLKTTRELMLALEVAGVDIVEVGVPFSDPTADGPVIQAASQRSLKAGTTLAGALEMIESLRQSSEIPIVLFGYYNPVFVFGNEMFAQEAKRAGVDGVLIVDLPYEESRELRRFTDPTGIDFISLIAPTSGKARVRHIAEKASGFLYYISITGITGTAEPDPADIERDVRSIREITNLPVVVGFGISTPQKAKQIAPLADGIVVGSAFVRLIEAHGRKSDLIKILSSFARDMRSAMDRG